LWSTAAKENEMALFKVVVEAFVASRELDQASLSRLAWLVDVLGEREIAAITADDIDAALVKLAERGRLKAGRGMTTAASGKPLAGSTVNRYLSQAGSIFKHAKRPKLVPRSFMAPTRGIERAPERADPEADTARAAGVKKAPGSRHESARARYGRPKRGEEGRRIVLQRWAHFRPR
jgi:hypothetical protein